MHQIYTYFSKNTYRYVLLCFLIYFPVHSESIFHTDLTYYPDVHTDFKRKIVYLPKECSKEPLIDGKLELGEWKGAFKLERFEHRQRGTSVPEAESIKGYVLRGKNGLFIAFEANDKNDDVGGTKDLTELDKVDRGTDSFAVQLNPQIQDFNRYRFSIGKKNVSYALKGNLVPRWNPKGWNAKYYVDQKNEKVSAEMFIPYDLVFKKKPRNGDIFAFNVFKMSHIREAIPGEDGSKYSTHIYDQYVWGGNRGESIAMVDNFPWIYFGDESTYLKKKRSPIFRVYLDRASYDDRDECGFGFIECRWGSLPLSDLKIKMRIKDDRGKIIANQTFSKIKSQDVGFEFSPHLLKKGEYQLEANLYWKKSKLKGRVKTFKVIRSERKKIGKPSVIPLVLSDHVSIGTGVRNISTAIPFPRGVLYPRDLEKISVEKKNAEWTPIPTDTLIRNYWYKDGSIKWLGLNFKADYVKGTPHRISLIKKSGYRLNLNSKKVVNHKKIEVDENEDYIVIDTHKIKAKILKKGYNFFNQISLDQNGNGTYESFETVLSQEKNYGLSHRDDKDKTFYPDPTHTKIEIYESSPSCVRILAEGFYINGNDKNGKFLTRMSFFLDEAFVKVDHTHMITHAATKEGIRNVRLHFPIKGIKRSSFYKSPGEVYQHSLDGGENVYLVQYRHDACRIGKVRGGAGSTKLLSEGYRSPGSVYLETDRASVLLSSRRFWQLYPKEIEVNGEGLSFHLWPEHGSKVFSKKEMLEDINLTKALFAHHGQKLSFQCPDDVYENVCKVWTKRELQNDKKAGPIRKRSPNNFEFRYAYNGWKSNGLGIAMSQSLTLHFLQKSVSKKKVTDLAQSHQSDVHALADPKWTYQTKVFGDLWPEDNERFGNVEKMIRQQHHKVLIDYTDRLEDYGMFIWPSYHQYPKSALGKKSIEPYWFYRNWANNHYQQGRTMMLLYLRSGDHYYWEYALDSTRHKMDVVTVNADTTQIDGPHKNVYGNYHVYGIFPWSGPQGTSCHFQNHDFKIWHSFLTGDVRGLKQVKGWAAELYRTFWVGDSSRDDFGTLTSAIAVFQAIKDHRLLKIISINKQQVCNIPIDKYILPFFDPLNWERLTHYTRDEKLKQRMIEHWGNGNKAKRNKSGSALHKALFYKITRDRRHLAAITPFNFENIQPYGFSHNMMITPYIMGLLHKIGAEGTVLTDKESHQRFWEDEMKQWRQEGKSYFGRKY